MNGFRKMDPNKPNTSTNVEPPSQGEGKSLLMNLLRQMGDGTVLFGLFFSLCSLFCLLAACLC
jgi:hypothetical protein